MADFNINNFVIDRALRGLMISHTTGDVMYSINQIEDPSLSITADEKTAVDAMGTTIATFNTAKNAEFSATNSLFDLDLLATQMGTQKQVATAAKKLVRPVFETLAVEKGQTYVTLTHVPTEAIKAIYVLNGDSTLGTKYPCGVSASATTAVYDEESRQITLPTTVTSGEIFVTYETETEKAVAVDGSAKDFPTAGKFILEILGCDVCDQTTLRYAYIIFPNAKLDANVDIDFTTDGKHPFTIKANQAYCDSKKLLFSIVIPE